jgi:hypothetical protein
VDRGYWPTLLIRDGLTCAALTIGIGLLFETEGRRLLPTVGGWPDYVEALELLGLGAIATVQVGVGALRRSRWLEDGPPPFPAPPAVLSWPPAGGEVWNAICTHENGNYKDRPVLLLYGEPEAAYLLRFTSKNKAGSRYHVALRQDDWTGVLRDVGYMELEIKPVPWCDFRQYRGSSTDKFWDMLLQNNMVRKPRMEPLPITFTRRQRAASAKNRHLGIDEGLSPPTPAQGVGNSSRGQGARRR